MISGEVVNALLHLWLNLGLGEDPGDMRERPLQRGDGGCAGLVPVDDGVHGWLTESSKFGEARDGQPALVDDAAQAVWEA